ncbi:MAG TPA: DUF4142 domain-containing protein [Terriglobales bacterium]|nr:DUF4142 domain-containing protein [Terriglobales bacterium]
MRNLKQFIGSTFSGMLLCCLLLLPAMAQTQNGSDASQQGTSVQNRSSQSGNSSSNSSESQPGSKPATQNTGQATDKKFVENAAKGGEAEVELGQLAVQKASSPEVRQFGQRMVDDHTKANQELQQIASQKGITPDTQLTPKDQKLKDRLSNLSGSQFDKAYMKAMVNDHKEDVAEFQKEARNGKDDDVRSFASKTLPTLKEHLRMAEQANGSTTLTSQKQ